MALRIGSRIPLAAALLLALAPSLAQAAGWLVPPSAGAWRAPRWHDGATLSASAAAAIRDARADLGLRGLDTGDLEIRSVHQQEVGSGTAGTVGTVRFGQLHHGLPVRGASVVLRLDGEGAVQAAVVDVASEIRASEIPVVSADEARALVGRLLAVAPEDTASFELNLGYERNERRGGILAWYVDAPGPRAGARLLRFVVDAERGGLLGLVTVGSDALGRVYAINPVRTPKTSDVALPDLVAGSPQYLVGAGGALRVHAYVSGTAGDPRSPLKIEQKTVPNMGADFLYDPLANNDTIQDPFAEVNIYYQLMRGRQYFTGTLGVNMSGLKWNIVAVANYGPDMGYYDNAFYVPWSGALGALPGNARNGILIGNGRAANFGYDSDIMLHEFTHYVNHNAINFNHGSIDFDEYGTVIMPGAIDEGTADYFSCTINDDPEVGEASLATSERDLSQEGPHCPDGLVGESHADGQSIANFVWVVRQSLGARITDKLLWSAMTMMPDRPTFGDVVKGFLQGAVTARLDAAQMKVINDALAARGLDECNRFIPIGPHTKAVRLFGLQNLAWQLGTDCNGVINQFGYYLTSPFEFTYQPAPADKAVIFRVFLKSTGNRKLSWSMYVRREMPVTFADQGGDADTFEYAAREQTANTATLVIDDKSDPPFDPNAKYYVAIGHQNCGDTTATVTASNMLATPDMAAPPDMAQNPPDMTAGAKPAESGCGCEVGGRPDASTAIVFGLLSLALLRRRRT